MVNRDGSADFKRKERYKQKLESVELTPSDEFFMKGWWSFRRWHVVVVAYRAEIMHCSVIRRMRCMCSIHVYKQPIDQL